MPLIYYRSYESAEVALWEATDSAEFYKNFLLSHDFPTEQGDRIKHPEKSLQWFASRYLLSILFPNAIQVYKNRKPELINGPNISFSHSKKTVAVMLSGYESGIDIQWNDAKLFKIKPKYTTDEECKLVKGKNDESILSMIWSVKEAVFKMYGTNLAFLNIHLVHHDSVKNEAIVYVNRHTTRIKHRIATIYLDDLALAYLIE